jgi:hypothetical protein
MAEFIAQVAMADGVYSLAEEEVARVAEKGSRKRRKESGRNEMFRGLWQKTRKNESRRMRKSC